MRRAAWIAIAAAAVGIIMSLAGRAADSTPIDLVAGAFLLVAIVAGLTLLPVWENLGLRLPRMKRMFVKPRRGQEWSAVEGRPVDSAPKRDRARKSKRS